MSTLVRPIYGNGWTNGRVTVEQPAAFSIEASDLKGDDTVRGRVCNGPEALLGYDFEATPRHVDESEHFNCTLCSSDGSQKLYGYCMMELEGGQ